MDINGAIGTAVETLGKRQPETELAADTDFTFHPDFALMAFDDGLDEAEANTCTLNVLGTGLLGAVEGSEKARHMFRPDADAVVFDNEVKSGIASIGANDDMTAFGGVLDGITDEIFHGFTNHDGICDDFIGKAMEIGIQKLLFLKSGSLRIVDHRFEEGCYRNRLMQFEG